MLSNPMRGVLLAGSLSLIALIALIGGPIAAASAEVTASRITSPADGTSVFYDATTQSPTTTAYTISGETTGTGKVDIRCYYGAGAESYRQFAKELEPAAGKFSLTVQDSELFFDPCVLRAVPSGNKEPQAPGSADPFQGPTVVASEFYVNAADTINYGYELSTSTLTDLFDFESAGECGLDYSSVYSSPSLAGEGPFNCNAGLYEVDPASPGRSEIQIDGANAYGPASARYVDEAIEREQEKEKEPKVPVPGIPPIAVSKTIETGSVTIHEVDPIVKCSPDATVVPPTTKSCKTFVSAGVELERTWQTSSGNRIAFMTDTWRSTDGSPHSLDLVYDQETVNAGSAGGAYELPGTSTFVAINKGENLTAPTTAGTIYEKEDSETASSGDGEHPFAAIVYDRAPSGPLTVSRPTNAPYYNEFEMPYRGTVPAGGTYTLRMAFAQGGALSEVDSLAAEAFATYHPTLTIGAPTSGTTVATPSVTVSGSAADSEALTSLSVGGHAVSVGAGGAWSTSVALNPGANTITAVATNRIGLTTEKSVTVTYTPPVAHATQIGTVRGTQGKVTFTLACAGSAGTSCEVESTLTTVAMTRNGRPLAVAARRHRHRRTHDQRIVVGASKLTIPAGQRVTIAITLNAAGKRLLARFGRLPVHLQVDLLTAGHRATVIAQNLTVTARGRHHKRHRHHHRH